MQINTLKHKLIAQAKRLFYGRRGEPYVINGRELRYIPGMRPIRLRYLTSSNVNSCNDAWQVKVLSENLKEGDVCLDIGAYVGQYSVLMAAFCGVAGQVYSFEPDPYARVLLEKNIDLNPTLKRPIIESLACSDKVGQTVLFSKRGNAQSSLVRSAVEFDEQQAEQIAIQTTTIDHYLESKGIHDPSWAKIDAEGAEIRILKGAGKLLSSNARIICELHPYAWAEFQNTYDELRDIVASAGRKMRLLSTREPAPDNPEYSTILIER